VRLTFLEQGLALLAPMAGILNLPLRLALRQYGWTTSWIGSIDAAAVAAAGDGRLINILGKDQPVAPEESPLVVQLLGNEVRQLSKAMALLEERVDAFDLNLGCPLQTVIRKGLGASLLEDSAKTTGMMRELARMTRRPLTAKIRLAPGGGSQGAVDLAQRLEAAGVAALVVHARTARQGFSGPADWSAIRAINERLTIPVIANGGIGTVRDVTSCREQTGCSWVMVGTGAIRNPFLNQECRRLAGGTAAGEGKRERLRDFAREYGRRLVSSQAGFPRRLACPVGVLAYAILRLRIVAFVGRH